MGPHPMADIFMRRGKSGPRHSGRTPCGDTQTHRHRGKTACEDGGRAWSDAALGKELKQKRRGQALPTGFGVSVTLPPP